MPKETIVNQIKTSFENLERLNFEAFRQEPGNYNPWNNLDINDFFESYEDVISILRRAIDQDVLQKLPWNILNNLIGSINNVYQHCQNLFNAKGNQQHFQNALQHLETLRTQLNSWGIYYYSHLGSQLEEKSKLIDAELQKLLSNNREIETIKENVKNLIEPAVAGSLSKSFSDRKKDLNENQKKWFWVTVILAICCIVATVAIVSSIVSLFDNQKILEALQEYIKSNGAKSLILPVVMLRIAILLPLYSIFILAFMQYKRERNLEEEYAHKYAVATSLPNYGDLAVDDKVKDQILAEASQVIFVSPVKSERQKERESSKGIAELSELVKNLRGLVGKSKE